jgi:cytochrome c oxidase assembly protein subunit 11
MPPLPRILHRHLSVPLARRLTPCHPWQPAADAFLSRGLASSSAAAAAAAAGREKSPRKTLGYLVGVAVAMVGASYAAVPLYRRFCQATGYGGTVQRREVCPLLPPIRFTYASGVFGVLGTAHLRGSPLLGCA